jgi:ribose transport system permease protein
MSVASRRSPALRGFRIPDRYKTGNDSPRTSALNLADRPGDRPDALNAHGRLDPTGSPPLYLRALAIGGKYGTVLVLVGMTALFWTTSPNHAFGSRDNLIAVLSDMAPAAIVAGGLTICLVAGDFDLSIGYQASFGSVLVVGLLNGLGFAGIASGSPLSIPLAISVVLLFGIAFGVANGLIVTKLGVNAFIATLGSGTLIVALNYWYGNGATFPLTNHLGFLEIELGAIFGIPYPILIMVAVLGLLWVMLNLTVLGQHIKAVGDDIEAAGRLGVNVHRTRIWAFVICGLCATGAGILLAAVLGSGDTSAGDVYLLQAYAAAFLGSAALRDGEFHIVGSALGVLTVAVGFNGLAIYSAPTFASYAFSGGLLVTAVALSTLSRRYARDV